MLKPKVTYLVTHLKFQTRNFFGHTEGAREKRQQVTQNISGL